MRRAIEPLNLRQRENCQGLTVSRRFARVSHSSTHAIMARVPLWHAKHGLWHACHNYGTRVPKFSTRAIIWHACHFGICGRSGIGTSPGNMGKFARVGLVLRWSNIGILLEGVLLRAGYTRNKKYWSVSESIAGGEGTSWKKAGGGCASPPGNK